MTSFSDDQPVVSLERIERLEHERDEARAMLRRQQTVDADAYRAEVDRLTRQRDEARDERDALRKALTARPGDIVILAVDRPLTDREGHEIHERATAAMPGVHVAIIPDDTDKPTPDDAARLRRSLDTVSADWERQRDQIAALVLERDELQALIDAGQPTLASELLDARAAIASQDAEIIRLHDVIAIAHRQRDERAGLDPK